MFDVLDRDPETTVPWEKLSETDIKFLLWLHDRGQEGLRDDCHCPTCDCDSAANLSIADLKSLNVLDDLGIVNCGDGYDDDGRSADYWGITERYLPDIADYRSDSGGYARHRLNAEMRLAELAMTPVFPEFEAQFKKEDAVHVG